MATSKRASVLIPLFQSYHDLWGGSFKSNGLTGRYAISDYFDYSGGEIKKVVIRDGWHRVLKLSGTRTRLYDKSYSDRLDLYIDALSEAVKRLLVKERLREQRIRDASF